MLIPVARGIAIFLGCFALANTVGGFVRPAFDANIWWIDLRRLGPAGGTAALLVAGISLLWYGLRPPARRRLRILMSVVAGAMVIVALCNTAIFYVLIAQGTIQTGVPLPLSLLVAVLLLVVVLATLRTASARSGAPWMMATMAALLALSPVAQMLCFGKTDYRRSADAIVVFGARAYADGRPSDALADRVRTGCELYTAGYAPVLIFSGGPGDGSIHETEAMTRLAVELGVPESAILTDEAGVSTRASVINTCAIFDRYNIRDALAVSHGYHLPRVKLSYQRMGMTVYTVPARESYLLTKMPVFMARETAALWVYYFTM